MPKLSFTSYLSRFLRQSGSFKQQNEHACTRWRGFCLGRFFIYRYGYENGIYQMDLLGLPVLRRSALKMFEKRYRRFIAPGTDHIYLLSSNLGELYCFLAYCARALLAKHQTKQPLFWATQRYHAEMVHLFFPQANVVFVGRLHKYFVEGDFACAGVKVTQIFPGRYYAQCVARIQQGGAGVYFPLMLEAVGLEAKAVQHQPIALPADAQQSAEQKRQALGLEAGKFVFITPEATTCQELPPQAWEELVAQLTARGLRCFFNIMRPQTLPVGAVTCSLSLTEAVALAKQAACIVSVKSGLSELLLQAQRPMFVLYTAFTPNHPQVLSAQQVYEGFTMEQLPVFDGQAKIFSATHPNILFNHIMGYLS